jgi:hypothetical protein
VNTETDSEKVKAYIVQLFAGGYPTEHMKEAA